MYAIIIIYVTCRSIVSAPGRSLCVLYYCMVASGTTYNVHVMHVYNVFCLPGQSGCAIIIYILKMDTHAGDKLLYTHVHTLTSSLLVRLVYTGSEACLYRPCVFDHSYNDVHHIAQVLSCTHCILPRCYYTNMYTTYMIVCFM